MKIEQLKMDKQLKPEDRARLKWESIKAELLAGLPKPHKMMEMVFYPPSPYKSDRG